MSKSLEQLQQELRDATAAFETAKRELTAATNQETKAMEVLVGCTIEDARFYPENEGQYVLRLSGGITVGFSASGDDMTNVTMQIDRPA